MEENIGVLGHHSMPQFIRKLYNILNDPRNADYIRWSSDGDTFIIVDPVEFCNTVLAENFKHSNISSFIRQLNKYDFHKVRAPASSKRRSANVMWEFSHPNFKRNRPELLSHITRKISSSEKISTDLNNNDYDQDQNAVFHNYVINTMANITKYFEMITEDLNHIKKIIHTQQFGPVESTVKVLIAEDNATCAAYASLIFKRLNFLTVSVESVNDFMFFFSNESFDMILLSCHVPNVKELIGNVRAKNMSVPIILTTDESEDIEKLYYKYQAVNKILYKPYSHAELIAFVKNQSYYLNNQKEDDHLKCKRLFYS